MKFARTIFLVSLVIWLVAPIAVYAADSLTIAKIVAEVPGTNASHQWIQVTNTGSDPIDLGAKDIRLVDHTGKHDIRSYSGSSTMLVPSETLIIAQDPATYLADHPSYTGVVLKSAFTLPDTGTVSIIRTDGTVLASLAYSQQHQARSKPLSEKGSSTKRGVHSSKGAKTTSEHATQYSSHTAYDPGTVAPTVAADAATVGARAIAELAALAVELASSLWFAVFLGLLAFSGCSLVVMQDAERERHSYLVTH